MSLLAKTILTVLFRLASVLGIVSEIASVFKAKQAQTNTEYMLLVKENGSFHVFPVKMEDKELSLDKACAP